MACATAAAARSAALLEPRVPKLLSGSVHPRKDVRDDTAVLHSEVHHCPSSIWNWLVIPPRTAISDNAEV